MRLVIGITGASGVIYGIRTLQVLQSQSGIDTHLVMTEAARTNIALETDYQVREVEELADQVHDVNDLAAPISSGTFRTDGMIIAPCSMKSLSAIVHSYADNLLVRAADVTLKESRKLVVMPRETPLHAGHCRLLLDAAQLGLVIAPPLPAFYTRPGGLDDIIDQSVGRVLDQFGLDPGIVRRWPGHPHNGPNTQA